MYDLLTTEEDKVAASLGWTLQYVFDIRQNRWFVQIFSIGPTASVNVVDMARQGHPLSIKALRLMANPVTERNNV